MMNSLVAKSVHTMIAIGTLLIASCASAPTRGITDLNQMSAVVHKLIPAGTSLGKAIQILQGKDFTVVDTKSMFPDPAKETLPANERLLFYSRHDQSDGYHTWLVTLTVVDSKVQEVHVGEVILGC